MSNCYLWQFVVSMEGAPSLLWLVECPEVAVFLSTSRHWRDPVKLTKVFSENLTVKFPQAKHDVSFLVKQFIAKAKLGNCAKKGYSYFKNTHHDWLEVREAKKGRNREEEETVPVFMPPDN